jgi:hypothetical protein
VRPVRILGRALTFDERAAATDAIRLGAISFDAVNQLVIAKVEC